MDNKFQKSMHFGQRGVPLVLLLLVLFAAVAVATCLFILAAALLVPALLPMESTRTGFFRRAVFNVKRAP
jgi:hypothetical protein